MKKNLLISLLMLMAFTFTAAAQNSNKDSGPRNLQSCKGGQYVAPVQPAQHKAVQCNPQVVSTTSAIQVKASSVNTPDDFPQLVKTGNPKADQERYDQAKKEWIARNPEKYKEMQQPK